MIIQTGTTPYIPYTARDLPQNPSVLSVAGVWAPPLMQGTSSSPDKLGKNLHSLAEKSVKLLGETGLIPDWKSKKDEISGAFLFLDGQNSLQNAFYETSEGKQTLKSLDGTLKIAASTQLPHSPGANLLNFGVGVLGAHESWEEFMEKDRNAFKSWVKPMKSTLIPIQTLAESSDQVPAFLPLGIGLLSAGLSGAQAFHTYQDPKAKGAKKALKLVGAVGEISKAIVGFLPAEQFGAWASGIKYFCLVVQVADKTYTLFNEMEGNNLLSTPASPFK